MRVPSSLKAAVELCGALVDISPEVVLHGVQNTTTEGRTTLTGKFLFFITQFCSCKLNCPKHCVSFLPLLCFVFLSGYMNGEPPADQWVKAQADRGAVKLRTQSWFESLKLGG